MFQINRPYKGNVTEHSKSLAVTKGISGIILVAPLGRERSVSWVSSLTRPSITPYMSAWYTPRHVCYLVCTCSPGRKPSRSVTSCETTEEDIICVNCRRGGRRKPPLL
ncbi:hypothetical protein J6590_025312 [Homalodisca vitripennis]|nr:hypothetical protein J6590_025312 [Homalodisca vitripennis]